MQPKLAPQKSYFITLEGIEGVGKSTCIQFLAKYIAKHQIPITVTREPGGTPFAEKLRELLLHKHAETICSDTELLLLFAGRAQHLSKVIMPALSSGQWVLSDRFTDASYAYQGGGRGIPKARITLLEQWVQGDFRPDITLILDAPVRKALNRTRRRRQLDRIETEKEYFFRKVRRCYLQRAAEEPKRYHVIDASQPLSKVKLQICAIIDPLIAKFKQYYEPSSHKK